jgi:predicted RNA methylase
MKAMLDNPEVFKEKIVLDLGSGTGILSMFAVKAGAKHVYAVEKANVWKFSKKIIEENNMQDRITVFNGMIEEIELPSKVDIIVSEWMGYFLVYEAMLDSVLFARDKWLKEGGILLPDKANIYWALLEDEKFFTKRMSFWDNIYGLSMKCMKKWVMEEPYIDGIHKRHVVSKEQPILALDL